MVPADHRRSTIVSSKARSHGTPLALSRCGYKEFQSFSDGSCHMGPCGILPGAFREGRLNYTGGVHYVKRLALLK